MRSWGQQAVLYELMCCHSAFTLESDAGASVWCSPIGARIVHWSALGHVDMEYHISVK